MAQNNSLESRFPVQQRIDGLVISFRKCLSESKAESLAFGFLTFHFQIETEDNILRMLTIEEEKIEGQITEWNILH